MPNTESIRNKWRIDRLRGDTKLNFFSYYKKHISYRKFRRNYEKGDRHRPNYFREYKKGIKQKKKPDNRTFIKCDNCNLFYLTEELPNHNCIPL